MLEPTDFDEYVIIANDEDFSTSEKGVRVLYEIFEHLSNGGTIYNYEGHDADQIKAVLAVAWVDVRDMSLLKKDFGETIE